MHRTRFSNAGGGRGDLEPQGRRQEAGSLAGVGPFLQTLVWVQGTQPLLPAEEGPWIPEEMSQRPSEHPSCSTSWKERGTGQGGGSSGVTPCTSFCRHTGTQLCPRTRIRTAGPRAGHGHRGAVVALRGGQRWRSPAGPLSSSCDMLQPHHVCTRKPSPSRPPTSHRPSRGPRGAGSGAALIGQAPSLNILNLTPCHGTHPSARGQEAPPRSPFSPEPAAAAGLGGPG